MSTASIVSELRNVRKPRVAVICGYMIYYDDHMPPGFRAEREAWGRSIADIFEAVGDVQYPGLLTGLEAGERIGRQLKEYRPDVIVLAPAFPAPAEFTWMAIRDLPDVPVVVWAAHHLDGLPATYDSVAHLSNSGNVGVNMIANMLVRDGRPPVVISGRWYDKEVQSRAQRLVKAAAAAGLLRQARIGVLGRPLEGYLNVLVDPEQLRDQVGATLVDLAVEEFTETYRTVPKVEIDALAEEIVSQYAVEVVDDNFRDACRLTLALGSTVIANELDGGTFNSHLEFGHLNPDIGLIGGLAHAYLTTVGYPFSETGDTVTAVAMFIGKKISGNALVTELNTIDYQEDAILCANTGEGDFCNAANPGAARILVAKSYTGKIQKGCIVDYEMQTGPATIIGFSPSRLARGGFVLVVMPGDVIGRPNLDMHVPHTLFRPRDGSAAESFSRWTRAGATHHACLSSGDIADDLNTVADVLGIEAVVV